MQAVRFLHKAFARALPSVHAKRLSALMCAVSALLAGRHLTLTAGGAVYSRRWSAPTRYQARLSTPGQLASARGATAVIPDDAACLAGLCEASLAAD